MKLYDSCSNGNLAYALAEQLAQLYRPAVREGRLQVSIIPVQQQIGGKDCGLFSIATALKAAMGKDLAVVAYNQEEIRPHLERCVELN